MNDIHNVVNTEFNQGGVHGSNALRVYMVVNAPWRSYIIRQTVKDFHT
jgi:hypothetical protein